MKTFACIFHQTLKSPGFGNNSTLQLERADGTVKDLLQPTFLNPSGFFSFVLSFFLTFCSSPSPTRLSDVILPLSFHSSHLLL